MHYVGWAVGSAVGFNEPACLCGEMPEHLVDVAAGREAVAAVLAQAVEDFGGDGPPLPLPHLGLLFLALAPPTPTPTPTRSRHFPSLSPLLLLLLSVLS